jgi:2-methylisocitrate lyase-like PEP mutase family enzyme
LSTQAEKAAGFLALHQRPQPFVIANPWDAGSARILAGLGFEALSTTSAGLAFSLGKRDGTGAVTRDEALENARAIVAATELPVAADLENGYGDAPEDAAETIRLAAEAGLVGGSIEDASHDESKPIYDLNHAVERVAAAVEEREGLDFHSNSWRERRIICTTARILTTRSGDCRHSRGRARRSCLRRDSRRRKRFARCARR